MNSSTFKGRSLLSWKDYSDEEIRYFLGLSKQVKAERYRGERPQRFVGMTLALLSKTFYPDPVRL